MCGKTVTGFTFFVFTLEVRQRLLAPFGKILFSSVCYCGPDNEQ